MKRSLAALLACMGLLLTVRQAGVQTIAEVKPSTPLSPAVLAALTPPASDDKVAKEIRILVRARELSGVTSLLRRPLVSPFVSPLGLQTVVGEADLSVIEHLAGRPEVVSIHLARGFVKPHAPHARLSPDPTNAGMSRLEKSWFAVTDVHRSALAWSNGYTGTGVRVMINDSGIDFCHPDLYGTWATVDDPGSPYHGWPMMFDSYSMYLLARDNDLGETNVAEGMTSYSDTSATCEEGQPCSYRPISATQNREFIVTGTSRSGTYHIGSHPDSYFAQPSVYGERLAVLVVDEATQGAYDTVYVDLNHNLDFSDDAPASRASPAACRSLDGTTVSGGLVYFIADGVNPVPASDWRWKLGPPENGSLVAFSFIDASLPGAFHGEYTASLVAGQGVTSDNPGFLDEPVGWVRGAAPDARLVSNGRFWATPFVEDAIVLPALGYDGVAGTADDVQIVSNSWNLNVGVENDGWDLLSRLVEAVHLESGANLSILFSAGNSASGYGSRVSPVPPTSIGVGASTMFGSVDLDSPASLDQVTFDDLASFSGRGPSALGDTGITILATGDHVAGLLPLHLGGGWIAGGGTSASCPVAAGNLALVYDAFLQTHGRWPDSSTARAILSAGARSTVNDTLVQGAGVIDAQWSTVIAGADGGIYVVPDQWRVGDWYGQRYPAFVHVARAGQNYASELTVVNAGSAPRTVAVRAETLTRVSELSFDWTTGPLAAEDPFDSDRPDYLRELTSDIPGGADLMVVRVILPLDVIDNDGDYTLDSHFRVLVYDWMDRDGDDTLWADDGNGLVNDGELDAGEYVRLAFSRNEGTAHEVRVQRPLERAHDGLFLGLQHETRSPSLPISRLRVRVEIYQLQEWTWVHPALQQMHLSGGDRAPLRLTMTVPAETPPGLYEGAIKLDWGDHASTVPVTVNVAAHLGSQPIILGRTSTVDKLTLYRNGVVRGLYQWSDRNEYGGDRRIFFIDVADPQPAEARLVARTRWQETALATDLDTIILGPETDDASEQKPEHFGPYTLSIIGRSEDTYQGGGVWHFATSTGHNEDVVEAPLSTGLHAVVVHNVLFGGEVFEVPFTVVVGRALTPRRGGRRVSF
jgi:hypothetical protein